MPLPIEALQALLPGHPALAALSAAGSDPASIVSAIGSLLQEQQATAQRTESGRLAECEEQLAALSSRCQALRDIAQRLESERNALRRRNAALAAALGACPRCWGEEAGCPTCAGEGVPGSAPPHPLHYQHYVAPLETYPTPPAQRPYRATAPRPRKETSQ